MRISEGFGGVPNDIDAATEWGKYIYFFKGELIMIICLLYTHK
jgi:hypothetical protein